MIGKFEKTTIADLLYESGDPNTEIRIFSEDFLSGRQAGRPYPDTQEWGILSVYSDDGVCIIDIEKLDED